MQHYYRSINFRFSDVPNGIVAIPRRLPDRGATILTLLPPQNTTSATVNHHKHSGDAADIKKANTEVLAF
jgi:hypothetical protein